MKKGGSYGKRQAADRHRLSLLRSSLAIQAVTSRCQRSASFQLTSTILITHQRFQMAVAVSNPLTQKCAVKVGIRQTDAVAILLFTGI